MHQFGEVLAGTYVDCFAAADAQEVAKILRALGWNARDAGDEYCARKGSMRIAGADVHHSAVQHVSDIFRFVPESQFRIAGAHERELAAFVAQLTGMRRGVVLVNEAQTHSYFAKPPAYSGALLYLPPRFRNREKIEKG